MAVIKDNRGALLASNIAQYLASQSNVAGTPIDTNQLVSIVNQFLGQGEQISSDLTTITNGIYKKFGTIDRVTNRTEIVTSGIWSGDEGSLAVTSTFTSSAQVASTSGKYYLDVYNQATSSDGAEVQFSIAYGDSRGFGAPTLTDDDSSTLPTIATYNQYKNILLDSADPYFSVYSGSVAGAADLTSFYVINVNRARYKERLDPGNISIKLTGTSSITLIDDSGGTDENVTTAGRVYNLVSGSLNIGSALSASIENYSSPVNGQGYGLFYPDMGIILLNPLALAAACDPNLAPATNSIQSIYHQNNGNKSGSVALLMAISGGADFQVRRTENVSTSHYFVRANNREFNFSNNPTFVSGSVGAFYNPSFERDPKVYITSVGLYDDANELLAVAKTSRPIAKSFDKEIAIKVKLDF
jgi:hypothetical protein